MQRCVRVSGQSSLNAARVPGPGHVPAPDSVAVKGAAAGVPGGLCLGILSEEPVRYVSRGGAVRSGVHPHVVTHRPPSLLLGGSKRLSRHSDALKRSQELQRGLRTTTVPQDPCSPTLRWPEGALAIVAVGGCCCETSAVITGGELNYLSGSFVDPRRSSTRSGITAIRGRTRR